MNIILNEHERAEDLLSMPSMDGAPLNTLMIISRYYLDLGYDEKTTRKLLDEYILRCDSSASVVLWKEVADAAFKQSLKRTAVIIDSIEITQPEMEIIESLTGKQIKRLALTLLCLSKYWDLCREANDHWVCNKDSDIMKIANINASLKHQGELYRQLEEKEMLLFPKKVNSISMKVLYQEPGETALVIKDFRNIGYQYLKYKGEPFFECEECGITVKKNNPGQGRPQKYCNACASIIKTRQNVNSVMRYRNK